MAGGAGSGTSGSGVGSGAHTGAVRSLLVGVVRPRTAPQLALSTLSEDVAVDNRLRDAVEMRMRATRRSAFVKGGVPQGAKRRAAEAAREQRAKAKDAADARWRRRKTEAAAAWSEHARRTRRLDCVVCMSNIQSLGVRRVCVWPDECVWGGRGGGD